MSTIPKTAKEWQTALADLPSAPLRIPAFFFAHGSPMLASTNVSRGLGQLSKWGGPDGPQAHFLRDFGKTLIEKYQPKGIIVFSAHFETHQTRLVSDYGEENPLLYDYYGFPEELYKLEFHSKGDSALAEHIVNLFKEAHQQARTTPKTEARGSDGRGFQGPGLDHGVFVPFRIMFGETFTSIPIVTVSMDSSLDPEINWAAGNALGKLREEGYLILSGGLTAHNLRDRNSFSPDTASPLNKAFDQVIIDALIIPEPAARKAALIALTTHKGFRASHPREDHFIPIYIAAGAGLDGENGEGHVSVLSGLYGSQTVAFGV